MRRRKVSWSLENVSQVNLRVFSKWDLLREAPSSVRRGSVNGKENILH